MSRAGIGHIVERKKRTNDFPKMLSTQKLEIITGWPRMHIA